jgi:hypothetical protein
MGLFAAILFPRRAAVSQSQWPSTLEPHCSCVNSLPRLWLNSNLHRYACTFRPTGDLFLPPPELSSCICICTTALRHPRFTFLQTNGFACAFGVEAITRFVSSHAEVGMLPGVGLSLLRESLRTALYCYQDGQALDQSMWFPSHCIFSPPQAVAKDGPVRPGLKRHMVRIRGVHCISSQQGL